MTARVVAFGGGHGLSATLRALCSLGLEPTAVVTVADNGGSSGRLREDLGGLPAGDLRQALVALADPALPVSAALFQHRFVGGSQLAGHAVGNLVLAGLAELLGDGVPALEYAARLLGCRGRVLPMAAQALDLEADLVLPSGQRRTVRGEQAVAAADGRISRVRLSPAQAPACPEAVDAVERADALILGPGSWFSSVLPHLLVPTLADAIVASAARKILVLNLGTDSETAGFSFAAHLLALADHAPGLRLDVVLADSRVVTDGLVDAARALGARLLAAPVGAADGSPQHDQRALAAALEPLLAPAALHQAFV